MLSNVKVGDTLLWIRSSGGFNQQKTLVSVERITNTQIITKVKKFRKRDGKELVGYKDSFYHSYVKAVTEEEIAELKEEKERISRQSSIDSFFCLQQGARKLDDDDAKQILTIIQKYKVSIRKND